MMTMMKNYGYQNLLIMMKMITTTPTKTSTMMMTTIMTTMMMMKSRCDLSFETSARKRPIVSLKLETKALSTKYDNYDNDNHDDDDDDKF